MEGIVRLPPGHRASDLKKVGELEMTLRSRGRRSAEGGHRASDLKTAGELEMALRSRGRRSAEGILPPGISGLQNTGEMEGIVRLPPGHQASDLKKVGELGRRIGDGTSFPRQTRR
jgi:hypothetical protein